MAAFRNSRSRVRLGLAAVATAVTTLAAPAVTAPAEPLISPDSLNLGSIPFDSELAAAVRMLKQAGVDRMALEAAQAVMSGVGQLSAQQVAERGTAPAAEKPVAPITDPLAVLKALGIQPLTPSVSPFCAAPTADNPLGLVTAGAGAVAGPWPLAQEPKLPFPLPTVTLPKLNLVDDGQTAYAFVPAAPTSGGKMQVAWFNTASLKGGFADLKPVANSPVVAALPLLSGVRLAPVTTGKGQILSAVYGSQTANGRSCYFLPAVGVVNA